MMKPPIVSGNRTAEDIIRAHLAEQQKVPAKPRPPAGRNQPPPPGVTPAVTSLSDYLQLDNISCVDADGTEFERYDHLYVRKDIERNEDKKQKDFTSYAGVVYFEQQGLFLPSFALSCNIIAALYQQLANSDIEKVLQQYKDHGRGYGWQAQNTVINYATGQVIHYPTKDDFAQRADVNISRPRTALSFSKATLQDNLLEDVLGDPASARYVRQLTGLGDPSVLVEIGQYFQKPTKLWFSWNGRAGATFTETRAAWLGCNQDYFNLYSNNILNITDAARGVHLGAPAGRAP